LFEPAKKVITLSSKLFLDLIDLRSLADGVGAAKWAHAKARIAVSPAPTFCGINPAIQYSGRIRYGSSMVVPFK
jgi:hypothetical protein